jgi:Mn2+/Fe2+ NRAMP family transporter
MLADMDASSIIGAAQLGSAFQYSFIWFLLLLILPLYIIQEASGRIGAVTRQGLGDTIRGHYSKATASLMVIPMFFADIATYVAEFLGTSPGTFISAQSLASVLQPVAGRFSPYAFGIGLIASGFLALIVVALASAWSVAEVLRIKKRQLLYAVESLPAVLLVLLMPPSMLVNGVIDFLVVFVFVLLGPAVILGMIAQDRKIMGHFAFSRYEAIAYWLASAFVLVFGIISAIISIW